VRQIAAHFRLTFRGIKMLLRNKSVVAKPAAMAVALAATTLAGAAFAADMTMPLKAPPPVVAPFFLVNDTSVSFTWYPNATDPGVCAGNTGNFPVAGANNKDGFCQGSSNGFSKYQGSVTHFDVWGYGTNFFNVDYIKSDGHDPIGGVAGAAGSAEVYAFGRSTLSGNALTSSKWFSSWFFKDIGLEFGGDANTENNQLSPEVRKLDLGLAFTFNLPGTVVLGVLAQKEWNQRRPRVPLGTAPRIGSVRAAVVPPVADHLERLHRRNLPEGQRRLDGKPRGSRYRLDPVERRHRRNQDGSIRRQPLGPRHIEGVVGQGGHLGRLCRLALLVQQVWYQP
jgi:hypothetical protein